MSGVSQQQLPQADEPTADDVAGMAWWGALSQVKRLLWLQLAGGAAAGASAASAWATFKQANAQPTFPARNVEETGGLQTGEGDR